MANAPQLERFEDLYSSDGVLSIRSITLDGADLSFDVWVNPFDFAYDNYSFYDLHYDTDLADFDPSSYVNQLTD